MVNLALLFFISNKDRGKGIFKFNKTSAIFIGCWENMFHFLILHNTLNTQPTPPFYSRR